MLTAAMETINLVLEQMPPHERVMAAAEINRRLNSIVAREITRFLDGQKELPFDE